MIAYFESTQRTRAKSRGFHVDSQSVLDEHKDGAHIQLCADLVSCTLCFVRQGVGCAGEEPVNPAPEGCVVRSSSWQFYVR